MMAKDNSHAWQEDEFSPEDNIHPEVQDKSEIPIEFSGSETDEEYNLQTPEQKLGVQKVGSRGHISETYLISGSDSSDISTKEGSEAMSSSSSSSDAESGTYKLPMKKHSLQYDNGDEGVQPNIMDSEADVVGMKENRHMTNEKDMHYEELLEKVADYEVELKFTKKKFQSSQEEIARLKYENLTLVQELGRTIEKLRTTEDDREKMEDKLRNNFQEGQQHLQGQLDLANQSIDQLQVELASERRLVSELQQMVNKTSDALSDYGQEIDELKHALHDAQEAFSKDRSQFQIDITHLSEQKDELDTRLKEAELQNKLLEEKIQQYEAEKDETRSIHEFQELGLLDEIKQLKGELSQRHEFADSMNKSLDASKLKYDMLMAEKDEVFAKMQMLEAEVNCRDIYIRQMEERISQLISERTELLAESAKTQKLAEELKLEVMNQEKELEKQRAILCDRADEKREAIKQLCFSLEYYRGEYHELRQALISHKRPAVLAS